AALAIVMRECARRNRVRDGIIYLQITRGVARRDHGFPPPGTRASVVITAHGIDVAGNERIAADGIAVITVPDNRWQRVDIKSISLLPNVLAKQAGREKGAREGGFVDRAGHVTEGSSSNAWIVTRGGKVVTRPADNGILRGITRTVLIDVIRAQGLECELRSEGSSSNAWIVTRGGKVGTRPADNGILRGITRTVLIDVIRAQGLEFEERPFTVEEAYGAREAFLTSASQIVMPVVRIEDRPVGNGAPGSVAVALRAEFHRHAERS